MKHIAGLLAVAAAIVAAGFVVGGIIGAGLQPADAQHRRICDTYWEKIVTPEQGYGTVVCSSWVNNGNLLSKNYFVVDPPTGYHIELTQVYAMNCSEAQVCSVAIWTSTSDSTAILGATTDGTAKRYALDFNTGDYGLVAEWPIRCVKVSFDKVSSSDDIMVLAYAKNY